MAREGVASAPAVADQGAGLVESAPELAGQGSFDGVVGVEVGGGQAVPDGVGGGPQERSGDQPVASLPVVVRAFPGADDSGSLSLPGSGSGKAARWTARKAVASMQAVICRCHGVHLRTWCCAKPTSSSSEPGPSRSSSRSLGRVELAQLNAKGHRPLRTTAADDPAAGAMRAAAEHALSDVATEA